MQVYLSRSQELLSGRKDNLGHINFPEQYLEGNKLGIQDQNNQ
jgi:hypothetical protein